METARLWYGFISHVLWTTDNVVCFDVIWLAIVRPSPFQLYGFIVFVFAFVEHSVFVFEMVLGLFLGIA